MGTFELICQLWEVQNRLSHFQHPWDPSAWAIFSSFNNLVPHQWVSPTYDDCHTSLCPDSLFRASWLHKVSGRLSTDIPSPSVRYKNSLWVAVAMLPKNTVKHIPLLMHRLQLYVEEGWTKLVATSEVMVTSVFTKSRDCLKGFQNNFQDNNPNPSFPTHFWSPMFYRRGNGDNSVVRDKSVGFTLLF